MQKRWLIIPPLTLVATLAAVELAARGMSLDNRQHEAIAVSAGMGLGETWLDETHEDWMDTVEELGVDYLPREFRLEDDGFQSRWGWCDFGFDGPSVLVLGDSTTRQSMAVEGGVKYGDLARHTWPALLQQELGRGVQVCVAAENGYHPRDQLRLLESLGARLEPAIALVLLCENDLAELSPRVGVRQDDALVFYRALPHRLIYQPLFWFPLYARSEAFRFLHWRLALAHPGQTSQIEVVLTDAFDVDEALRRMRDAVPRLGVYFLPTLEDEGREELERRVAHVSERAGVPIQAVPLPAPLEQFRKEPSDDVHANLQGHERIVATALPQVRGWLQVESP